MRDWRKIKGVVIIEGNATMKTVGFQSLKELIWILKGWSITGSDDIAVHILRGDGAMR